MGKVEEMALPEIFLEECDPNRDSISFGAHIVFFRAINSTVQ